MLLAPSKEGRHQIEPVHRGERGVGQRVGLVEHMVPQLALSALLHLEHQLRLQLREGDPVHDGRRVD